MTKPNDFFSDDLNDLLSGPAPEAPRQLPQDEAFARIRQSGIGHAPVAPTFKVPCQKCNGRGRFISYSGRDCGPCYTCKGQGSFERKTNPVKLADNRQKAEQRRSAQIEGNWAAFVAQFPKQADVLVKGAKSSNPNWNRICQDVMDKVRKYGDLHQGTMDMLDRAVAREAQFAASRVNRAAERQEQVKAVNVANLAGAFQRAAQAGIQRLTLRFNGLHMQVDRNDRNTVWVSASGYGSAKYGLLKVAEGTFRPGRDLTPEVIAHLEQVSADPMAAAKAYAQVTSSCSVCGKGLTNEESIDEGMGPVCAGRLRTPGSKFVEVPSGAF